MDIVSTKEYHLKATKDDIKTMRLYCKRKTTLLLLVQN